MLIRCTPEDMLGWGLGGPPVGLVEATTAGQHQPWNVPTANPKGVTHCRGLVAVLVATVDVDPWSGEQMVQCAAPRT
jgi:hypothetical protein